MGPMVVPALIQEIEKAPQEAGVKGCMALLFEYFLDEDIGPPDCIGDAVLMQINIASVLGDIGERTALPALDKAALAIKQQMAKAGCWASNNEDRKPQLADD
jgi:hypothetical protein